MRRATLFILLATVIFANSATVPTRKRDLGKEALDKGDGWASNGSGVTGGKGASGSMVFSVTTWSDLRKALGGNSAHNEKTPRIIYVSGTIHAMSKSSSSLYTCQDFANQVRVSDTGKVFNMNDYFAKFNPAGPWGKKAPSGPLEEARKQAALLQLNQIRQRFGSNVSLIGVGNNARIIGAHLYIRDVSNVIVRNLQLSDAYDCFPEWDPNDGSEGNWNSLYDNISIWGSTNIWIDHNTFDDGDNTRQKLPVVFGRMFEVHDGLLDITQSANYVTVSYNFFDDHDRTNLLGSSDSLTEDRGKIKVTFHHNRWRNPGQRAPFVRFGQVDVYNNYYDVLNAAECDYLWGVGVESAIYAEKNAIDHVSGYAASKIIRRYNGKQIFTKDNVVNGAATNIAAVYNAAASSSDKLSESVGWTPSLRTRVNNVNEVKSIVTNEAGAGKIESTLP